MLIPIDNILPNPEQPRREFDRVELEQLAASIQENYLIQPITVEQIGDQYILHDGERRLRAVRLIGRTEIEAYVIPPMNCNGSFSRLANALVANIQRTDLNPIEEARAYKRLRDEFGYSISKIAVKLGTNTTRISNRLSLLELDLEIQDLISADGLGADFQAVRAIKKITSKEARISLARKAAQGKYSIKEIISAAKKITQQLDAASQSSTPYRNPSLEMALYRTRRSLELPKWDSIAQVGRVPPWDLVEKSSYRTCDHCSLRSMASSNTCQECPLPAMLKTMIEATMALHVSVPLRKKA